MRLHRRSRRRHSLAVQARPPSGQSTSPAASGSMPEMDAEEIWPDYKSQQAVPEVELQVADTEQPTGKPQGAERGMLGNLNAFAVHPGLQYNCSGNYLRTGRRP